MNYDFNGKRALVTGAGKGIGRATVKALAQCGAEVIAFSRTQSDLDSLKEEVKSITAVCIDLADIDMVKKAIETAGPIHLLVNNAAVAKLQHFLDVTVDAYDRVCYYGNTGEEVVKVCFDKNMNTLPYKKLMDTNVKAVLFLSQYVAKGMVDRGEGGAIVNVSSQASQCALKEHSVYCTSKAALDMLTKVMGLELGPHKIRVNSVNPTVTMTDMGRYGWSDPKKAGSMLDRIPLRRFAEVEDVVNPILFLLSEHSAMINCATLPVDGGFLAC